MSNIKKDELKLFHSPSIIVFIITAVVFLLQLIPFTGIFLMMLAAPFWSVILVNLGLVLMIYESLIKKSLPKKFIIFPIIYVSFYFILKLFGQWQSYQAIQGVKNHNNEYSVIFDNKKDALVFKNLDFYFQESEARELIENYEIDKFYTMVNSRIFYKSHKVLEQKICNDLQEYNNIYKSNLALDRKFNKIRNSSYQKAAIFNLKNGKCILTQLEILKGYKNIFYLKQEKSVKEVKNLSNSYKKNLITITTAEDKKMDYYKIVGMKNLGLIPKPILGCYLNSSLASWNCQASFMQSFIKRPIESDASMIAKMLQISQRSTNNSTTNQDEIFNVLKEIKTNSEIFDRETEKLKLDIITKIETGNLVENDIKDISYLIELIVLQNSLQKNNLNFIRKIIEHDEVDSVPFSKLSYYKNQLDPMVKIIIERIKKEKNSNTNSGLIKILLNLSSKTLQRNKNDIINLLFLYKRSDLDRNRYDYLKILNYDVLKKFAEIDKNKTIKNLEELLASQELKNKKGIKYLIRSLKKVDKNL